jgi:hypothetical protein
MCLHSNNCHEINGFSIDYFAVAIFFDIFYSSKNTTKIIDQMLKNRIWLHYSVKWLNYAANENIN